jgi:hypothetical protein
LRIAIRSRLAVTTGIAARELIMRIAIALIAASLMLTGCKRMVGPAPETPAGDQAAAAAAGTDPGTVTPAPADDMSAGQVPNPAVNPGAAPGAAPPAETPAGPAAETPPSS